MIIDFHSHILPAFDDGADNSKIALAMLKKSRAQGVDTIVSTSHCYPYTSHDVDKFLEERAAAYKHLMKAVEGEDIPDIIPACELHLTCDLTRIGGIEDLCVGKTNYILIEMPVRKWTDDIIDYVYKLSISGLKPIIVHDERNIEQPAEMLGALHSLDILIQINSGSFGMPVYQPGYYWYRISDTTGCTVESQTAVVREREFTLSLESSGKIPPNGKAVVTAVVDGAEEPVEYRWWWLGDMETGEGATSLPETGETCSASRPGEYRCLATDDAGNFKSDYITVEAEGTAPIITKQPEGFTFPWQEDLTCYSAALSCDAEAYDGAKDVLEYRWEYHYGTGNWGGSQTGREFPLPKLTQGGFFRCIVTDTRSGEKTTSETAVIRLIMTCEAKSTTGLYHSNLKYTIRGGMGPFTIRVYARRIQGEYEDGTPFYHEELLHTTIREKSTGYITLPDAVPYEYPGWDGGNIVTRKAVPELYIVVEDHSDQVAVSFSEAN